MTAKVLCWIAAERRTVGLKEARGTAAERAARRNDAAKDIGAGSCRGERCRADEVVVAEDIVLLQCCCLGRRRSRSSEHPILGDIADGNNRHIT